MGSWPPSIPVSEPPWATPARPPAAAGEAGGELRPGGFWRRALALLVDAVVWWLLLTAGDLISAGLARWDLVARAFGWAWTAVVPAAYAVLSHGTTGQTLGKRLAGVRVVDLAGEPIGYPRALGRWLAWLLSAALLFAGFLVAPARSDRRALHDLLAGTRVVRVR
jgi:uncharacterized RDD family membrane protein YckC